MKTKTKTSFKFLVILLTVFIFTSLNVVNAYGKEKINVKLHEGIDSKYKVGYITPFYVEIENNLKDIDGEVQILTLDRKSYDNYKDSVTAYSKKVNLPKGSTKTVKINLPVNNRISSVRVKIIEGKEEVFSEKFLTGQPIDKSFSVIGILSDDFDSVNYINSANHLGNIGNLEQIQLNSENFPEELELLKVLDIILINDFNTSKLNENQYDALKKWVFDGGTLLIGTGSSHSKTLSLFTDDFIKGSAGELKQISSLEIMKLGGDNRNNPLNISILDLDIDNGEGVIEEENNTLLYKMDKGRGKIGVAAFDFGLAPLSYWPLNGVFSRNLLNEVNDNIIDYSKEQDINYWSMRDILDNSPEMSVPNSNMLMIIFFVYIIIAAPVSYIILKKKDKREYMWITVPCFAVIFSIIVYFMGLGTKITDPIVSLFNIIEINDNGYVKSDSYGSIFIPNKKDIEFNMKNEQIVNPVKTREKRYNSLEKIDGPIDTKVNVYNNTTSIEYLNNSIFTNEYFQLSNKEEVKGDIEYNIALDQKGLKGTIKNNTGYDFEDCFILSYKSHSSGKYISIGKLKKGESKEFHEAISTFGGGIDDFARQEFNFSYGSRGISGYSSKEIKDIREKNQKTQMIEFYAKDILFGDKILAFTSNDVSGDALINGKKSKKFEKSLIVKDINIDYGDLWECGDEEIKFEIIENNFKHSNIDGTGKRRIFSEIGDVRAKYIIDQDINIEEVSLYINEPWMLKESGVIFYLWNNKEEKWQKIESSQIKGVFYKLSKDEIEKFILNNEFKIKMEVKKDYGEVNLPEIEVKGSDNK